MKRFYKSLIPISIPHLTVSLLYPFTALSLTFVDIKTIVHEPY